MPRRTADQVAETRAGILARSVDVASTDGLEGLTIGRLAADVGMSKAGLLGHFATKEGFQLATLEEAVRIFAREVWDPASGEPPGLRRLRALAESWLSHLERGVFPGGCFITAASIEFDDRPGVVRDAVARSHRLWLKVIENEVLMGVAEGEIRADTDPGQVAFELNAILLGANMGRQLHRDPTAASRARRAVERLLASLER